MIEPFIDEDKSLACVHCGLCLSACPTYLETGNENDSPRGRIYRMRALQSGRLPMEAATIRHIDRCLGCRACESACPSGVEYGHLLEHTRDHIEHHHRRGWFQTLLRRIAIEQVFPFPRRLKMALFFGRLMKRRPLIWIAPRMAREALELVPEHSSASRTPKQNPAPAQPASGQVGFIEGCVMQVMFARTNEATVQLLNQDGWDVHCPENQTCCGALYAHSGQLAKARACARRNIAAFESQNLEAIIINAAGCGSTLKEYGQLLADDPEWVERAIAFSAKVKDLTEWISQEARDGGQHLESKVTYHDACHLAHPQGITLEPRALVQAVAGEKFTELNEADVCCGSAGSYNLTEPEMAARLQQRKIKNILATGAEIVVTTNPGCLLQIQAGLKKANPKIQVLHIADFLATSHAE
ncbi:MAG: (Fe-S)-binding protein [Verrucomicrobiota bacterium]|nr:(Fe-S)-binding protein [Verrucomicrobiota bacterium]